eukprot:TRINITY_DN48917_c0_g1_i1.p1 TRINITY_DN48917_c0_g1~~TRINITY_DN48917_c0_g1_i1.p1  ORF type:complete len:255 (+),score=34.86 TRINITY_DN48917_c0_g1_i1:84-848(+)
MASNQADERTTLSGDDFSNLSGIEGTAVRHAFVQKVYGILGTQLLVTTAIGAMMLHAGRTWMRLNPGIFMLLLVFSAAMTLGIMCVWMCKPELMRESPANYIILALFTVAQSILVGAISMNYTQESVLIVLAITVIVVLSLTLFACQTTYDFTGFAPYMFVALMVLLGFGFVLSICSSMGVANGPAFQTMRLVYAGFGALLFSGYIVMDTQMVVGGKHSSFRFSLDDYCMAAIVLYQDIVQLFLFLLQLFGERR